MSCHAQQAQEAGFSTLIEKVREATSYENILASIQAQDTAVADTNIWTIIFNVTRNYWNGIVNAYNNWAKDYNIGDWCMAADFQQKFSAGLISGFFKVITLQYVNVFQYAQDISVAYTFITDQLYYCKGNGLTTDSRKFVYDLFFWYEIGAIGTAILANPGEFVASIPL